MNIKRLFVLLTACVLFGLNVRSEETKEYKLTLSDFTELKVNDPVNVEYHACADSAGMVFFSCSPDVVDKMMFTLNKSSLNIQVADDYNGPTPTVKVYSTSLEKVENGSDSTIHVIKNVPVTEFKAKVMGNGSIIIDNIESTDTRLSLITGRGLIMVSKGTTFKAKYSNVGTGTIQAGGLKAAQVKATVSGTGTIDCCATESLTITGMGSGTVYYTGNPQKVLHRSVGIKAVDIQK